MDVVVHVVGEYEGRDGIGMNIVKPGDRSWMIEPERMSVEEDV